MDATPCAQMIRIKDDVHRLFREVGVPGGGDPAKVRRLVLLYPRDQRGTAGSVDGMLLWFEIQDSGVCRKHVLEFVSSSSSGRSTDSLSLEFKSCSKDATDY